MQTSMISPTKQRMKFTVSHHQMKQHGSNTSKGEGVGHTSTSSFEFQTKDRSSQRHSRSRTTIPSKWNDAEKWILNKQNVQVITISNTQNRRPGESLKSSTKQSMKRADLTKPRKFEFGQGEGANALIEVAAAGIPAMRDMGTEMTPIPSQEPSRSPTPVDATTPLRSPSSSLPSSPQKELPASEKELSEQEMKSKIAREIVALGVHLGKMNIVAWASKDERDRNIDGKKGVDARIVEYRKRGDAWEETEKSKHEARFKREEIRIQAWESRQKAKSIAKTRRLEMRIEQMRARIRAKMASVQRKIEEKRAAMEARKNQQHQNTIAQAEYIRQTGRVPSTYFTMCWSRKQFHN